MYKNLVLEIRLEDNNKRLKTIMILIKLYKRIEYKILIKSIKKLREFFNVLIRMIKEDYH